MSASIEESRSAKTALHARRLLTRLERVLVRLGDRLNPILVKETRQALKSKQFVISFGLVLVACWVWSVVGVALIGPRIYYSSEGSELFYWYYLILTFPLAIIIPYSAYRSLAAEGEDNTLELLSITTLKPYQIVGGKLGSALLQMLVYFSAVTPCLVFTYVLRGIDILTVGILLTYALFASVGLSIIGLFAATITRLRYAQVLVSVALVIGLAFIFIFLGIAGTYEFLRESSRAVQDEEFWVANAGILTAFVTYAIVVLAASASQLTFTSENRSTALRWAMLLQHVCLAGWMVFLDLYYRSVTDGCIQMLICMGIHWFVMGSLMTGESPVISDRVKRGLPQSFLGRALFTWFNPGPGTGYMFAVVNMAAGTFFFVCILAWREVQGLGTGNNYRMANAVCFAVLLLSYLVFFLGTGNLLLALMRKFTRVFLFTALVVQLLLLLLLTGIPLLIQLTSPQLRYDGYTLLQITNPFWTLGHFGEYGALPNETFVLMTLVPMAAMVVWLLNLPAVAAEVRHVRIARPKRVQEEDAQLAAVVPEPTNPWDDR